jgi:hypothetical protein
MADTFTVEFDKSGNIVKVVDINGKTTFYKDFLPLSGNAITNMQAVTTTQVFVANSCYIYQNGRLVKVC